MSEAERVVLEGYIAPGFERVREAFAENFQRPRGGWRGVCGDPRRSTGGRSLGRARGCALRAPLGGGHDGRHLLGDEGARRSLPADAR